jgi:hypothetical protein
MIRYGTRRSPAAQLVLVDVVRYCDTAAEHEVRVLTDGHRAYAYGQTTDTPTAWRLGSEVTIVCGQPGRADHACEGTVTVDLTEPGIWEPATAARVGLLALGTEVDR